jgi:hypothetical protein
MHEHYKHSEFINGLGPWLLIAVVIGLCGLAVILWLFLRNRSKPPGDAAESKETAVPIERLVQPEQPPPVEERRRATPAPEESDILDLLWQNGGPMSQTEIAESLGGDAQRIAETLKSMESQQLIERQWDAAKNTFSVSPV